VAKIPTSPEEITAEFARDMEAVFGEELVTVALFGSAARGEYVKGKSDINFLVVVTEAGMDRLPRTVDVVDRWRKRAVAVPLFLTREYIESSLDTFPIEFLNMQRAYRMVQGEDVLEGIAFDKKDLRLQLERETKSTLLHLRQSYVSEGKRDRELLAVIAASLTQLAAIFTGILHYLERPVPERMVDVMLDGARALELDPELFQRLLDVRTGHSKPSKGELTRLMDAYRREIRTMWKKVDQLGAS
jgi:predicted nucleotidyltransferase